MVRDMKDHLLRCNVECPYYDRSQPKTTWQQETGVTWGDANYWCLCPSGEERGLSDLKCSFLLHFGAQSLFFKNAKQCFCITGKLQVSVSNVMPQLPISFHEADDKA